MPPRATARCTEWPGGGLRLKCAVAPERVTVIGEASLQLFLERRGWPRPMSNHIIENGSKAVLRFLADD